MGLVVGKLMLDPCFNSLVSLEIFWGNILIHIETPGGIMSSAAASITPPCVLVIAVFALPFIRLSLFFFAIFCFPFSFFALWAVRYSLFSVKKSAIFCPSAI